MSQVNAEDTRIIASKEDVLSAYDGINDNDGYKTSKTGIEIELAFFKPETTTLDPISVDDNEALMAATEKAQPGDWMRQEPTAEMLEVNSIAHSFTHGQEVLDDAQTKIGVMTRAAADLGFRRSLFQDLPHLTAQTLLGNIVNVERYQAFFNPPRADMDGIAAYFSVSKSNQVSVSYPDHDHMLDNVRRLYYLAPFLFMLSDNSAGFAEGKQITNHHGLSYRNFLGDRGGVPPYLFTATTGEDYLHAHINHVMRNPLYVYYDENSVLTRIPSGEWESFNNLTARGLNTAANYYLAESILWPDVKIAALKDKNGVVNGHRFEARMFGVGIHQHQSAFLIVAGLAFCPELAAAMDDLLKEYGFDPADQAATHHHVEASYQAALHHNNQFFDIAYGTGNMRAFALRFADILEAAKCMQNYQKQLTPILDICRSAMPDAKVNQILFPTLEDVNNIQRNYDPAIFNDPNSCHHIVFEKELRAIAA